MLYWVEIALCAIVIVVFAVERFSIPPRDPKGDVVPYRVSRSTTTAASYYTAVSLYGGAALGVFAFLLLSPSAVDRVIAMAPDTGQSVPAWARQSPPLLVALILTVLLSKIPVLASMDEWFRTKLQRMAAIPQEVRRLSAELRRAPFSVDPERRQELVDAMVAKGFDRTDVRFEEGTPLYYLWTKLSALMRELDGWEAESRFASYVLTYPNEFNTLQLQYETLQLRTRKCFGLLRDLAKDPESTKRGVAMVVYRDDLVRDVEGLLKNVYEAISHAVLLCELTHRARVKQLIKLGFQLDPEPARRLTLNELLGLFTGLTVVFTFAFVAMRRASPPNTPLGLNILVMSLMTATIYCVAVWCAIYPKSRWSFARKRPEGGRPWGWYLMSGVTAAAAAAVISYSVKLAMVHGDFAKAWDLYRQNSPWAIMTFATAYGLAFLADDEPRDGLFGILRADRLRWVEGIALTALMATAAWLVHTWLVDVQAAAQAGGRIPTRPPRLLEMELLTIVIGLAIGSLVPSWYRSAPLDARRETHGHAAASVGRA